MLRAAPELIAPTPLAVQLPDAAIVRGRSLIWTPAAGLVLVTRCVFPNGTYQAVLHRYDAAGACTSAHTLDAPIIGVAAGGSRLAFSAGERTVVLLDLGTGTKLDERNDSFSAVVSASGETWAFSGFIHPGCVEVRSVSAAEHGYPPPIPRNSLALWVDDEKNLLFSNFDTVSRYAYVADESTVVCSHRRGRGEGDWVASADGETVAYVARTHAYLYSVRDGRELGAHRIPGARSAWCAGPLGALVVAAWSKKIYLMRGAERREIVRGVRADAVAISPDGRRVAWTSETDDAPLCWSSL